METCAVFPVGERLAASGSPGTCSAWSYRLPRLVTRFWQVRVPTSSAERTTSHAVMPPCRHGTDIVCGLRSEERASLLPTALSRVRNGEERDGGWRRMAAACATASSLTRI